MSKIYKKNVLITGGAGFIGSHICDRFIEDYNVVCIDNLVSGKMKNINHLIGRDNFIFLNIDIGKINCNNFFDKIDFIFHFASLANLPDILKNPINTFLPNSHGTYELLNLAKFNNAKFILASTSEIYGNPLVHPQHEEYWGNVNPIGVRSVYDESKRFAETLTKCFNRIGVDTKIVRIFNTYGPRMSNDGRVMINFITQALMNEDITIYGNGKQTRSFCYIDDLVDGIFKLAFSDYNDPVNIGNIEEITIGDLANKIRYMTNTTGNFIYKPLPMDDPYRRKPDIDRARKVLNYEPKIGLDAGIIKTIDYVKKDILK